MDSLTVRSDLLSALQLDLIGPEGNIGDPEEVLPQTPSRWYLTGFIVPTDAKVEHRVDPTSDDQLDQAAEPVDIDSESTPEKGAARKSFLPSSMGTSVLISSDVYRLHATVAYGLYQRLVADEDAKGARHWQRVPHEQTLIVDVPAESPGSGLMALPGSGGVELVWSLRDVPDTGKEGGLPVGTRSLSLYVVNRRTPGTDDAPDEGAIFQVSLKAVCDSGFVARPNLGGLVSTDWDERVSDLQYRDTFEFLVGHGVSTDAAASTKVATFV